MSTAQRDFFVALPRPIDFCFYVAFNGDMTDSELIDKLGGPAKVAARLGYDKAAGGVQRVHNWRARGIPASVRLNNLDLFPLPKQPKTGRKVKA